MIYTLKSEFHKQLAKRLLERVAINKIQQQAIERFHQASSMNKIYPFPQEYLYSHVELDPENAVELVCTGSY